EPVGEEGQVVSTVVEDIIAQVSHECHGQVHVVFKIIERHFGFDHPELRKVAGRVGVLRPEAWTERINLTQRECMRFAFELSRDGKVGFASEKVFPKVYAAVFGSGRVARVEGCHPEHCASTFSIGTRDDGRMNINEASVVKKCVDGIGQGMSHSHYRAKRVGSGSQMCDLTKEFKRVALGLKRVFF